MRILELLIGTDKSKSCETRVQITSLLCGNKGQIVKAVSGNIRQKKKLVRVVRVQKESSKT